MKDAVLFAGSPRYSHIGDIIKAFWFHQENRGTKYAIMEADSHLWPLRRSLCIEAWSLPFPRTPNLSPGAAFSGRITRHSHNQLRALNISGARVSPPGDSLVYGCEASQRQGLTGSMSSDLRATARDRVRRLSACTSAAA